MVTLRLRGRITEMGELDVKLPDGLPPGDVQVDLTIQVLAEEYLATVEPTWTPAELAALLKTEPKTGAQIVEWLEHERGWADDGSSGVEWVEAVRRREQERRQW
jgi:hypothetical protein